MHDNNIGTLRFFGAFFVLLGHGFTLSAGDAAVHDPLSHWLKFYTPFNKALPGVGVMLFFVLSGYLITASFQRSRSTIDYCLARFLRIYPALFVAVIFCLLIGLFFTTLPAVDYLRHPATHRFFTQNTVLFLGISFHLPGVFSQLPWPNGINGSLWTLPVELGMYGYVFVLGVLKVFNNRLLFNIVASALVGLFLYNPGDFPLLTRPGYAYLGLSFLLGAAFYINRERINYNLSVLAGLVLLSAVLYGSRYYNFFALITFTYGVLFLGLSQRLRLPRLDKYGDLSYGLYLYAFPVQQTLIYYIGGHHPWLLNLSALIISLVLAVLSWRFIEQPVLARRITIVNLITRAHLALTKRLLSEPVKSKN
ncbi:acyltransferase [Halioxenophilus sp. WMMB6]|uniref:acyltransferase family protein n=1 Tax=Halioxenophilus sp. WMMB6 TaxID=3073815 RepID=UPI00295E978F|nr:acyltransferase [Halioxenophilus sp. WMMB6]